MLIKVERKNHYRAVLTQWAPLEADVLMCLHLCTAVVKQGLLSDGESHRVIITITEKYSREQTAFMCVYVRLQRKLAVYNP